MKIAIAMFFKRLIGFFMKKFTCVLLCLALALGFFCPVFAQESQPAVCETLELMEPEAEEFIEPNGDAQAAEAERLKNQSRSIYRKALWASGKSSLQGFCGLMTGLQIWKLGITKSAEIYNGNGFYDAYKRQSETSNGYSVKTIDASEMHLEEALYHVSAGGTRNVYNLIACFQWTNTRAGAIFGHAVVIHGIVNGMVYFVEGFPTSLGGGEGNPLVCTIGEFENFYGDWTSYEGLVVLGDKRYADFCKEYPTDLFITAPGALILEEPREESGIIRTVQEKELLRAGGLYQNPDGAYFYRVDEGYIEVSRCGLQQVNIGGPAAEITLPEIEPGKDFSLGCKVISSTSNVNVVQVNIADENGKLIQTASYPSAGRMCDLPNVRVFGLEQGVYRVQVLAMVENTLLDKGQLRTEQKMHTIYDQPFGVGQEVDVPAVAPVTDGWVMVEGVRYFYQDGAPRVGWYCDGGLDYYFAPNGAVTTGWAKINGKWRCFTDTGVMRTGWVDAPWGRCYLLSNGEPAVGIRVIDGVTYRFDADGALMIR